jgi:hypothetical protein
LLAAGFLWSVPCRAAFLDGQWGARPAGMGNAFVAIADDGNAPLFNPAGAVQSKRPQGIFTYAKPFAGLEQVNLNRNAFSVLLPTDKGLAFGASWSNLIAPSYREDIGSVSAAFQVDKWSSALPADLALGLQLNYLNHQYQLDDLARTDSVFADGRGRSAVAVGASFLMNPRSEVLPGMRVGGAGKYLNNPDVGLSSKDTVPREMSLGLAYRWSRANAALDVDRRDKRNDIRFGMEAWLYNQAQGQGQPQGQNQASLRAGINRSDVSVGASLAHAFQGGFTISLDYAFLFPMYVQDVPGSHVATLGVRF